MMERDQEEAAWRRKMSQKGKRKGVLPSKSLWQEKGWLARPGREKEKKVGRQEAFQAACFMWQEERHAALEWNEMLLLDLLWKS